MSNRPNNKLRDLLMKRTKWDGQQATQVSDALTEAIIAYRTLADIRDSGSMTYNLDPDNMPSVRHVVVTIAQDTIFSLLCLENGDTLMIDFDGISPYNPIDAHRPLRVSKKLIRAARGVRRG